MKIWTKQCVICGESFEARAHNTKACSDVCRLNQKRERDRARQQTPEYKEWDRARQQTPEWKEWHRAYKQTPEYKEWHRARRQTPEWKERECERDRTPEYRAQRAARNPRRRVPPYQTQSEREKIEQLYIEAQRNGNHVDHVVPRHPRSGQIAGTHTYENLQELPGPDHVPAGGVAGVVAKPLASALSTAL